ncbi:MAG: response regulator [Spirochaetia bacterium]
MKDRYILLVEDNQDDVDLTLRAFKKNNIGNQTVVVRDGAEALDFIFARGEFSRRDPSHIPIVILLDLNLPKIDGLKVLKAIRENPVTRLIPVVVLTTSKTEADIVNSYSMGANSFIQKPVDFKKFTEVVSNFGLYWLLINEAVPKGVGSGDTP